MCIKNKFLSTVFLLCLFLIDASILTAEDPAILEIRKEYTDISKNKAFFQKKTFTVEHDTESEIGFDVYEQILVYYEKKEIHCIISDTVGDLSGSVIEYYYHNNSVFFIYKYDWNGEERTKISEDRFYFKKSVMIRWISEKDHVPPLSDMFMKKEKEMMVLSKKYLNEFGFEKNMQQVISEQLGMPVSIEGPLSMEYIEQSNIVAVENENGTKSNVVFGYINKNWLELKKLYKDGDIFFEFDTSPESWEMLCGSHGYVLIREDKVLGIIVAEMN